MGTLQHASWGRVLGGGPEFAWVQAGRYTRPGSGPRTRRPKASWGRVLGAGRVHIARTSGPGRWAGPELMCVGAGAAQGAEWAGMLQHASWQSCTNLKIRVLAEKRTTTTKPLSLRLIRSLELWTRVVKVLLHILNVNFRAGSQVGTS